MSKFSFRATLDDAVFVLVILAGFAVSAAMEIGAMLPVLEQGSAAIVAQARGSGAPASRVASASAPNRVADSRLPAKVGS